MSDDDKTTVSLRLPKPLREKIKERASGEERSESAFIRFHLSQILDAEEATKEAKAS